MAGPETFNPAVLKPVMKTSGGDLKPSLVTSAYSGGTPGAGDLKPSLLKPDGDLKESLLSGGSLKAALTGGGTVSVLEKSRLFVRANSEYLSIASNSTIQLGDYDWTIAGWFRMTSNTGGTFLGKEGGGDYAYRVDWVASQSVRFLAVGTATDTFVSYTIGYDNDWHFFVAWFDASANFSYLQIDNGTVLSDANTVSPDISATPLFLGAHQNAAGSAAENFLDGALAGVGIWKRELTSTERISLYNSGSGLAYASLSAALKVDLQAYWNLDEDSGNAIDSHGSNDLTDNNTVGSSTGPGA